MKIKDQIIILIHNMGLKKWLNEIEEEQNAHMMFAHQSNQIQILSVTPVTVLLVTLTLHLVSYKAYSSV